MLLKPENQSIYKRQIALLLFLIVPAAKLLLLPTLISYRAKQDSALTVLIGCAIDFLLLYLVTVAIRIEPQKNLFSILKETFGKLGSQIIMVLLSLYFMMRAFPVIFEQKGILTHSLYQNLPFVATIVPYFIVLIYVATKGPRVLGRNADFFWIVFAIALVVLFFLSVPNGDFTNLLPVLYNGPSPVLEALYSNLIWFGDFTMLFCFMGRFAPEKKQTFKSLYISAIITSAIVVIFFATFTAVFGETSSKQIYALAKMSKYTAFLSNTGRFDWISIFVLLIGIFLNAAVMLYAASECIRQAFELRNNYLSGFICGGILFVLLALFGQQFPIVYDIYTKYLNYFIIIFQIILPLILPLLALRSRRKAKAEKEAAA